ncbi:FAD-binding oxidoreductase [Erythrobacter insulae]|uniref:FAD-binding oxidoreductase n=1 Tax=Erythrobacter insulae TaxID=2584124 RepID=A0A547P7G7_9SPHN|nr:FAD-dependent oxidoreductase [Erythrobacter insulae]TRD10092.1 FAD-binding oxidoreductase [Erythrobacter insulae]
MNGFTRRQAVTWTAAGTLVSACSGSNAGSGPRIAVIGAGIVGASIAYHLAKGGAQVTILDRHDAATRASRGTFAWLNATWAKQPRHYHRLNQLGLARWQELEKELGIPVKWGGSIEWFGDADRQDLLARQIAEQVAWGEPAAMIGPERLGELEPKVNFAGVRTAAFSPNDGAVDPVLATRSMIDAAAKLGAVIKTNCAVLSAATSREGASILQTDCGDLEVDAYVLATGADPDAAQALANMDLPQRSTPGVIVVTKPADPLLDRILVAPGVHIHQRLDGRIVLGEQDGAPQNNAHAARLADRPNRFPNADFAGQHSSRIMAIAEQFVPGISRTEIEDVYIGWRPLPLDGHPVMGFAPDRPNAYIAIAHSGVSLAPILGKLAAQEILGQSSSDLLADYRPDRDFAEVRRY